MRFYYDEKTIRSTLYRLFMQNQDSDKLFLVEGSLSRSFFSIKFNSVHWKAFVIY